MLFLQAEGPLPLVAASRQIQCNLNMGESPSVVAGAVVDKGKEENKGMTIVCCASWEPMSGDKHWLAFWLTSAPQCVKAVGFSNLVPRA